MSDDVIGSLYERYMDTVELDVEAQAALSAARYLAEATPEYRALLEAEKAAIAARNAVEDALKVVKATARDIFLLAGERQPHPYVLISRVDLAPKYDLVAALQWCKSRPDFQRLVLPEHVDQRGFEKVARAMRELAPIGFVDWQQVPAVSVKIREDA